MQKQVSELIDAGYVEQDEAPVVKLPSQQTLVEILEERLQQKQAEVAESGQLLASVQAAQSIAENYGLSFEDVRTEMRLMARNLWHLLDTPEGWMVLGMHIDLALTGRTDAPLLRPAIH